MSQIALPLIFAVLAWWISTGALLYVVRLPSKTYPVSIAAGVLVLVAALITLACTPADSASHAYVAFTGALAVWGFVELTFLTGTVTGPRRTGCPPGTRGWRRARYATEAIIYHEFALVAAGLAVLVATWRTGNPVAATNFALLWIMRLSSKLNLFLGVRFLNDDLLPAQLQHLRSYFRRAAMNPLFPLSVAGSATVTWLLASRATAASATEFEAAGLMLLASLLALALVEHLFMVVPIPVARLWGRRRERDVEFSGPKPHPINPA